MSAPAPRRPDLEGSMKELKNTSFAERMATSQAAKKALLEKFKPKAAVTDPDFARRAELKAAELEAIRAKRAAEKEAARQAKADAAEAKRLVGEQEEAAVLDAKRGERKERKQLSKAEAKAKRDAKYAARQARR